jgi:hypothetical protein
MRHIVIGLLLMAPLEVFVLFLGAYLYLPRKTAEFLISELGCRILDTISVTRITLLAFVLFILFILGVRTLTL